MATEYGPLRDWLTSKPVSVVVPFDELDDVVPGGLPPSARKYAAWWNNEDSTHSQCWAWHEAGYRAQPIREAGRIVKVRFTRISR